MDGAVDRGVNFAELCKRAVTANNIVNSSTSQNLEEVENGAVARRHSQQEISDHQVS